MNYVSLILKERRILLDNLNSTAYQILYNMIFNEKLERNVIYSETKIAQTLGFSRTPIRDAVRMLSAEGLIDVIPNKGFSIHILAPDEILNIFQVRCAIEGYCSFVLTRNKENKKEMQVIKQLEKCVKRQEELFKNDSDLHEIVKVDQDFHMKLICHMENSNFDQFFKKHLYQLFTHSVAAVKNSNSETSMLEAHKKILDRIKNSTPYEAYGAIVNHLEAAKDINYQEALRMQENKRFSLPDAKKIISI
jgi:DNA-binding GntR family transcriptional regulator